MESLEGRLLLAGQPTGISLSVPPTIYEGKKVVIQVRQPADYFRQVQTWHIKWGDGTTTTQRWDNTVLHHVFALYGTYSPELTASLHNGQVVKLGFTAEVKNVRPAPKIDTFATVVPNQPVRFKFSLGDSAPLDTLKVSWNIADKIWTSDTPGNWSKAKGVTYIFTKPGKYEVDLTTTDEAGLVGTTTRTIVVAPVAVQPDPANPAINDIVVGGTNNDDVITFRDRWSAVEVFLNGESYGLFSTDGKLVAFGGPGNDVIAADATIDNNVAFDGGEGKDTLAGGSGTNQLFGDPQEDTFIRPSL